MPNWSEILNEIQDLQNKGVPAPLDVVRRNYLKKLAEYTGRNTIVYYSGWLTAASNTRGTAIGDDDINGLMATIHKMDRTKGLDLVLHTPGGDIAATEAIVSYLRLMFGTNIRAIVPQLAMSAGTMIACSTKQIVMGKQSSLGPFDPQNGGISAPAVLDEFKRAIKEITNDPACTPLWQVIIGKYHPTYLDSCHRATVMAKEIVGGWLKTGMFEGDEDAAAKAEKIVSSLSDHDEHKTHARHLNVDQCETFGLKIIRLEQDPMLQDLVLSVHHSYMHTCAMAQIIKIIENDAGVCVLKQAPSPGAPPTGAAGQLVAVAQ